MKICTSLYRCTFLYDGLNSSLFYCLIITVSLLNFSCGLKYNSPAQVENLSTASFALEAQSVDGPRFVVYMADQDTDGVIELYSARADGMGEAKKLNPPLGVGGEIYSYRVSPDNSWVVYRAKLDDLQPVELFSVPLDGSADSIIISGIIYNGAYGVTNSPVDPASTPSFAIAPGSSHVVFSGVMDYFGRSNVFSTAIDGSEDPVNLSNNLSFSGSGSVYKIKINADSTFVVYALENATYAQEVWRAPMDGSSPATKIHGPLGSSGWVDSLEFEISPDGSWIVYVAQEEFDSTYHLYVAPTDGSSAAVNLVSDPGPYFTISPDSFRVVFEAQITPGVTELFSIPIDGSTTKVRLSGSMVPGGEVVRNYGVGPFLISADSSRVIYGADQLTDNVFELFSAPIDGSETAVKISGTLVANGDVGKFEISADSSHVVYRADQETYNRQEIYSVPIKGAETPVRISNEMTMGENSLSFFISPDSSIVVYLADHEPSISRRELFSAPIDGSKPAIKISGPMAASGMNVADDYKIVSGRVIYRSNEADRLQQELFSVPVDGSEERIKVSGSMVFRAGIFGFSGEI